ncbi:uncharacterized protein Bfra_011280 [Botrytis fragariae]|uniref:Uncharacterized protein n=1 Tax=Botrytis fragariae TaxID=1964551 RepID=A0A8H6AKV2_9HELO|nr:uncharacterized protein Bfra_011280 [Botrytis fragariae]KAF5869471.1 hypothetical protein Bfra_011280 [Botrytis fragariae]
MLSSYHRCFNCGESQSQILTLEPQMLYRMTNAMSIIKVEKRSLFRKQKLGTIERTPEILADSYERGATMEYLHTDQEDEINLKASIMVHFVEGNKSPGK